MTEVPGNVTCFTLVVENDVASAIDGYQYTRTANLTLKSGNIHLGRPATTRDLIQ